MIAHTAEDVHINKQKLKVKDRRSDKQLTYWRESPRAVCKHYYDVMQKITILCTYTSIILSKSSFKFLYLPTLKLME